MGCGRSMGRVGFDSAGHRQFESDVTERLALLPVDYARIEGGQFPQPPRFHPFQSHRDVVPSPGELAPAYSEESNGLQGAATEMPQASSCDPGCHYCSGPVRHRWRRGYGQGIQNSQRRQHCHRLVASSKQEQTPDLPASILLKRVAQHSHRYGSRQQIRQPWKPQPHLKQIVTVVQQQSLADVVIPRDLTAVLQPCTRRSVPSGFHPLPVVE